MDIYEEKATIENYARFTKLLTGSDDNRSSLVQNIWPTASFKSIHETQIQDTTYFLTLSNPFSHQTSPAFQTLTSQRRRKYIGL